MQKAVIELPHIGNCVNSANWKWKRWDVRSDGKVFWQYARNRECWVSWEQAVKRSEYTKRYMRSTYDQKKAQRIENGKKWRIANAEKHRSNAKDWAKKNKKRENKNKRIYRKNKRNTDPIYSMQMRMRTRTTMAFKQFGYTKSSKTQQILGCDWETLKAHIESQFLPNMGWHNKHLWHIDHIIPIANAKSKEQLAQLCHYSNLQPLWAIDNLKKGKSIQTHQVNPKGTHQANPTNPLCSFFEGLIYG